MRILIIFLLCNFHIFDHFFFVNIREFDLFLLGIFTGNVKMLSKTELDLSGSSNEGTPAQAIFLWVPAAQ